MEMIQTALGEVEPAKLGFTLFHEHTFILSPGVISNWPQTFDREAALARSARQFQDAAEAGIRTIVDVTTADIGRDISLQRELAMNVSINLIVATGMHLLPPRYILRLRDERIVQLFLDDISRGIGGTTARAGVLKIASGAEVTPQNERLIRCVARAHRATGVPIITHSDALARTGAIQQDILADEGVDLKRVVIGHVGDTTDLEYLTSLAARGSFLGLDRFAFEMYQTIDARMDTIAALSNYGLVSQLLISHDTATYYDAPPDQYAADQLPDWNYLTVPNVVVPGLKARGLTDEQIRTILIDNPRRMLTPQR